jgi:hypothetical protein
MANKKEIAALIVNNISWENWRHEEDKKTGKNYYSTNEVLLNKIDWVKSVLFDEQTEELDTLWMLEKVLELVDIDEILKLK